LRVPIAGAPTEETDQHTDEELYVLSKTEPRTDLRPGMSVKAQVDHQRLHLFDPQTGENWVRRPAS
jgi:hypothetical protein